MSAGSQLKIKLEKHELKIFRFGRQRKLFCDICQIETLHLTVSQMSKVLEISELNVFRLTKDEQIHTTETKDGRLMFCANSINQKLQEK